MGRGGLLLAADGALLVGLWPSAQRAAAVLGRLDTALAERGSDAALAALAGGAIWLVAAWLAAGLVATVIGALPGRSGRLARRLADRLLPRALHRIVAGSAGLGVLLAPVAAVAQPSAPPTRPAATVSTSAAVPTPGWPLDQPAARQIPTPGWPLDPAAARPIPTPAPSRAERPGPSPREPVKPDRITVRPGDSLWLIAARRIDGPAGPARVAAEWPRWYAANRALIGPDPDLIRPGQVLHAPGEPPGGEP